MITTQGALRARIAHDAARVEATLDGVGIRFVSDARDSGLRAAATERIARQLDHDVQPALPALDADGHLPSGIWRTSLGALRQRFGGTAVRDALLAKLELAVPAAHRAGARHVLVGGSFLSAKPVPGDVDGVVLGAAAAGPWRHGVTPGSPIPKVRQLEGVRLDDGAQVDLYDGRWVLPDDVIRSMNQLNFHGGRVHRGETMLELFRHDRSGAVRGVVLLEP